VLLALIAGGFTLLGVLLKIGYDSLAARRASKKEALTRFAPERREAYEKFLGALTREREYWAALHDLKEAHGRGEEVSQERMDNFPPSPMKHLVEALDEVRRVGRTYAVISSAENIVRLFVDMAAASRLALTKPGPDDEITWFILQRLQDDRIQEFIHAYREDLGIGPPCGGSETVPDPGTAVAYRSAGGGTSSTSSSWRWHLRSTQRWAAARHTLGSRHSRSAGCLVGPSGP
jgi:hypothetical protein